LEVRLSESKERNRILQEKITANRQQIDSLTDQCRFFLSLDSRALLQEWKTNQDRLQNLEERLSGCNRQLRQSMAQKTDLDEKTAELDVRNRSIVRAPIFWGITCAILSGVTGGVTYWSLNDFYLGWAVLVLSAAFSVPIVIFSEFRRRRRSRIRNELSKSAKLITADLAELEGRRRSNLLQMHSLNQKSRQIAETVLQRPSASLNDIIQAETQSARAEQPYRRRQALEAGLKSDLTDLRSENNKKAQIERSLEEEHQDLEEVEAKWKKWILGQGLDQDLGPQIAVEFIRKIRDLKRSLQDLDEEHRAIDLLNRRWQEFCQKVDDLSSFMGAREPGGNPLVAVEYWTRKEREAREAFAEKKSILQKEADLKLQLSVSKAKALEAQDRILALYEAAEVADEEAFREKSRLHERFERLDHERRIIVERLVQGLSFKDEETVRESLSAEDWERNERRLDFLKVNLAVMRAESEDLATLCGKLTIEIDRMEHEDESDQLLAEKQEQTARMNKGVKELIETRIAHVLLENTLKLYEVEKQPRVLEKTSEIFRNITGNGFRRVIFPLNGASIKVERANGTSVDEELLSRGTLEQLYLSFRLAHLDVYHRDKPSIPLVMDDVLVNFDPVRARRTASVLAEFSGDSGIQIIFFTCHPHTGDLFPQCTPILRMGSTISSPKI
jgi:uncharacterized protein YhaN